jgi:hypothetical protein
MHGIGDGTHGSSEFFTLKHRLFEFLAKELGFNTISLEAGMADAMLMNRFVHGEDISLDEALAGLSIWIWRNEELRELCLWMREYNRTAKSKLAFTGMDAQTPETPMQLLAEYLQRVDPTEAEEISAMHAAMLGRDLNPAPSDEEEYSLIGAQIRSPGTGKHQLRLRAKLKTADLDGYAGLWIQVGSDSIQFEAPARAKLGLSGTQDWTQLTLERELKDVGGSVRFGALMQGYGSAWFDDLILDIDGIAHTAEGYAPDFEDPLLNGFLRFTNQAPPRTWATCSSTCAQRTRITGCHNPWDCGPLAEAPPPINSRPKRSRVSST